MALAEATFDITNDEQFQTFNETTFGSEMVQDVVEDHIAGFYSDLMTILGDFKSFQEHLMFRWGELYFTAIFRYEPEAPVYCLKQKHSFRLPSGTIEMKLTKTSGDCTGLRLDRTGRVQWLKESAIVNTTSGSLWIPDNCVLYINWIQRRLRLDAKTAMSLQMANRLYQRPHLQGMYSTKIALYVERISDLPSLQFSSYLFGRAQFGTKNLAFLYIVPSGTLFRLYLVDDVIGLRDQIIFFIHRKPNCEIIPSIEDIRGLTIESSSQDLFKITINRYEYNEIGVPVVTTLRSNCDMEFQRIIRTFWATLSPDERTNTASIELDSPYIDTF